MALAADHQLFLAAAEHGSLSAAARRLAISPALASKRLQRLEERLGVTLAHRTTRRFVLTAAGERFRDDLAAVAAALTEAEARMRGAAARPSGRLRVSAPTSFGRLHVAPLLAGFLALHPEVALTIDLDDGIVDLVAARVDCAIRIGATVPDGLAAHRIGSSRRVLCAAPAYLAAAGVPDGLAALGRHRLLAAEGQLPWQLVNGAHTAIVAGTSHVRTNSSELVRELALAGVGIALRSLWDVDAALADGRLVRICAPWEGSHDVGIYVVHPRAAIVPPAVAAFVACLRERLDTAAWDRPADAGFFT